MPFARGDAKPSMCSDSTRSAPTLVGQLGPLLVGGAVARAAGEPGLHAEGVEPALQARREIPGQLGLDQPVGDHAGVVAAVARVEDDALAEQARAGVGDGDQVAQQLRPAADHAAAELAQRAQRAGPADAVGDEAVVALEAAQRRRR